MAELKYNEEGRLLFTKEMRDEGYTILTPQMMPIHFKMLERVFRHAGYNLKIMDKTGPEIAQTGLKYVHNDTCYPALLVIGQFIYTLQSGDYDVNKTALMMTQTGGGCRASNYIFLLRKALKKAGFENIPVISLSIGMETNPGFKLTIPLVRRGLAAFVYGDLLTLLSNQTKAYEINKGESMRLVDKWVDRLVDDFNKGESYRFKEIERYADMICREFSEIKLEKTPKVKVGVVGEIYVKYSSLANNDLVAFLESQDCEVNVPGVMGFAMFKVDNRLEDIKLYGGSRAKFKVCTVLFNYLTKLEAILVKYTRKYGFTPPGTYSHIKKLVKPAIGYGSKMGEGWLLTAEMLELAESGYENIVCTQPFGCLPNHINGKGAIRRIKELNPKANIVTIDYDPGAPKVNQENRIKLMLAVGREELENQNN